NRDQRVRRTTTQRSGHDFCVTGEENYTARQIETRAANPNLSGEEKKEPNCCSMFYLSKIEHKLPLPPPRLVLPIREAIHMELEKLFLDKVIANLGLCISVYDIISIDGGFIFPGDGAPTYTVVFNLIMFRPFVGEIITARLISSDSNGLQSKDGGGSEEVEKNKDCSENIVTIEVLIAETSESMDVDMEDSSDEGCIDFANAVQEAASEVRRFLSIKLSRLIIDKRTGGKGRKVWKENLLQYPEKLKHHGQVQWLLFYNICQFIWGVSLGFFDDIYVPAHHMPWPNHFVEDEQGKRVSFSEESTTNSLRKGVWFWDFNEQEYPIQETDVIKFRVQNVSYPQIPVEQPKESKPFAPMLVTGSLDHDGLGPVSWWSAEEIEVDDE
ncbi:hypothetical protein V8G54_009714, partial [Vigna mungo]